MSYRILCKSNNAQRPFGCVQTTPGRKYRTNIHDRCTRKRNDSAHINRHEEQSELFQGYSKCHYAICMNKKWEYDLNSTPIPLTELLDTHTHTHTHSYNIWRKKPSVILKRPAPRTEQLVFQHAIPTANIGTVRMCQKSLQVIITAEEAACLVTTFLRSGRPIARQHMQNSCRCWVKRDRLDVTCFIISLFNAEHVSDVNTSILRSLRLICWLISWVVLIWFAVCWCYVVVWLGWCGIRMQAKAEALLFLYSMLNMFRMLIHPSSGACDLFVELFHGLYCSGSMCVGVTLWFGWGGVVWCGIRMQAEALQPDHNVTPTHIEPEQYNPWNNSTNKSQATEDGCINIRNMLSIK